jgi:hypothetical protein
VHTEFKSGIGRIIPSTYLGYRNLYRILYRVHEQNMLNEWKQEVKKKWLVSVMGEIRVGEVA